MHTKQYSIEHQQFLVNGIKCELSVDRECLSWRPSNGGVVGANSEEKFLKRVNFAQVIGFKRWLPDELHHCIEATEDSDKKQSKNEDIFKQKSKSPAIRRNLFDCKRCDKIKIYYSKQNDNKSSGQLLKLKKVIIEPVSNTISRTKQPNAQLISVEKLRGVEGATAYTAEEPLDQTHPESLTVQIKNGHTLERGTSSYYTGSEGSNSHLSSLSSSSSASQTVSCNSRPTSPANNSIACSDEVLLSSLSAIRLPYTRPLEGLANQIEACLEPKRKQRPRRLLVFVNPFGGKGRAPQLYKSQVSRLLDVAGVEAKLVVTKYANHARDTIEDPLFNVEFFDGIVCVGGDGMFSELMNGLLFRYNRDLILKAQLELSKRTDSENKEVKLVDSMATVEADPNLKSPNYRLNDGAADNRQGRDHDTTSASTINNACDNYSEKNHLVMPSDDNRGNKNNDVRRQLNKLRRALGGIGTPFVSPPIPLGVIGAGSTDANSFGLIGTNDVITATLNIILGNQIKIDVCSVHSTNEDRLLRFVSTFVAYGYFGDVIRESEKFRWLGPSRYDLTGANNLIKNRAYKGSVRILVAGKDGTPFDLNRCHANCELCCLSANSESLRTSIIRPKPPNDLELSFIERKGHFIGVNAAVTACRCPQTKKGFSPNNHLANGCLDLILVRPCTRIQYVQYLMRTGWTKKSAFDLKYVEVYRCRQFEFIAQHQGMRQSDRGSTSSSSASSSSSSSTSIPDQGSNHSSLDSKQSACLDGPSDNTFSSWNVDGEIMNEQSLRVKVNNQLLRVFGTGEPSF